ncbi:MAG: hypothetical protein Q4A32_00985 [Lachnospiraceae bacterium]|nr:hypothetical protein [Lachnospiraceae bacterium]
MSKNRSIGATLKLNGEKEFKSAVSGVNKEISTMKSSMTLLKEQTAGQSNTLETLRKKHDILDQTLQKYREKQEKVSEGLRHSESEYNRVQKEVAEYKKSLDEAERSLDEMKKSGTATTEEIEKQNAAVEEMRKTHQKNLEVQERAKQGTEEWKNKLTSAETQVLKASKALAENDRYMAEAEKSSDNCATSIDRFGKKTNETTQRLGDLNTAFNNYAGSSIFVEFCEKASEAMRKLSENAYNAAVELDKGYDTIAVKTGATGEELEKFKDVADGVFGSMPVEMEDVGKAVGDVSTRFGMTGKGLEETSEIFLKFAKINKTDVTNSVNSSDRIMQKFHIDTKDTANMLGMFTKVGQDTGLAMDTLMGTLDKNGDTLQELGFSLEDSTKMLAEFEKNGVDTSGVMAALRKGVINATKEGKNASGMLAEASDAIINAKSETEALQIATEVFGSKGALVMTRGLRDGRISLGNTSDAMKKYGDVVTETFEATISPWDETKVAMNNLKAAGSDLAGTALYTMMPAIEKLTKAIKGLREWFGNLSDSKKKTIAIGGTLIGLVGTAFPKILALKANLGLIAMARQSAAAAATAHAAATAIETSLTEGATIAQWAYNMALDACPILAIVGTLGLLITALAVMSANAQDNGLQDLTRDLYSAKDASENAREALKEAGDELADAFDSAKASIDDALASSTLASRLTDELVVLNNQTDRTAEQQARMEAIVSELNTLYPELGLAIDSTTGSLNKTNEEIVTFVENAKQMAMVKAYQEAYAEVMQEVVDATKEQIKAEMALEDIEDGLTETEKERAEVIRLCEERAENLAKAQEKYNDVLKDGNATEEDRIKAERELQEALSAVNDNVIEYNGTMQNVNDILTDFSIAQDSASEEVKKANEAIEANKGKVEDALAYSDRLKEKCEELGGSVMGAKDATDEASASIDGMNAATDALSGEASETAGEIDDSATQVKKTLEQLRDEAYQSISQQIGLFEELALNSEVSLESMNNALISQQSVLTDYAANIEYAMQYAMNSGSESCMNFVQSIANMGEDGAAYMAQFVAAIQAEDGSAEQILSNFAAAEDAKRKYADQMASMEQQTQESTDGMVKAVADAEGDMANAALTTAEAGARAAADASGDFQNSGNIDAESYSSGVASGAGAAAVAASNLSRAAENELAYSNAYAWGQDMGYNFADGLGSTYSYVAGITSGLANAVAMYLHHSTPEKGPLAGDDKWGEEMGDMFAEGLASRRMAVGASAERLATAAADGFGRDIAAGTVRFAGITGGTGSEGIVTDGMRNRVVVENRFYLDGRDVTDLFMKKIVKGITTTQQSKKLAAGAFAYV